MPEQVRCPSCNAALRVPDNLLGQNVKCPKCQRTFVAEMEEPPEPQRVCREPSARRRPKLPDDAEDERLLDDEYEEPLDEYEDEEAPRPRRRRGRRRYAEAESLVSGPAISLLVVGIIDIVLGLINMLFSLLGINVLAMDAPRGQGGAGLDAIMVGVYVIQGIADIIMGSLITIGATKMKNLSSYGFAMTACILAMIPCVNCCILGLPFGIWGLTVLNNPEVKDAFR